MNNTNNKTSLVNENPLSEEKNIDNTNENNKDNKNEIKSISDKNSLSKNINFKNDKNDVNNVTKKKKVMHSGAQLAFEGDAVFELLVRSYIVENYDYNVNIMHRKAIDFVKASAQANFIKNLDSILTDEERKVVKRGRNAKVTSPPKNQNMIDYRYATGLEALFGYLYLKEEKERIKFLFDEIVKMTKK